MPSDLFSISVSGLNAAQTALTVTSNNIANVATPGYTAQYATQNPRVSIQFPFGFMGTGTDIQQILRAYDQFLVSQVRGAQNTNEFYAIQQKQLKQVDELISSSTLGVGPALQDFFGAMQSLSLQPSSISNRQNVLDKANALVSQLTSLDNRLLDMQQSANKQTADTVKVINQLAKQIAELNQQISQLTGGDASAPPPNSLLDQRDQIVMELNKLVDTQITTQKNGMYTVSIGNGQTLVSGDVMNELATAPGVEDPSSLQILFRYPNGLEAAIPPRLITGGQLGGILQFRDTALLKVRQQLGMLAIQLSSGMNYQNQLGKDAKGNAGQAIFSDVNTMVSRPENAIQNLKLLINDPKLIATASNLQGKVETGSDGAQIKNVWSALPGDYITNSNKVPPVFAKPQDHLSMTLTKLTIQASTSKPVTLTASLTDASGTRNYNVVPDSAVANGYKLQTQSTPPMDLGIGFQLSGAPSTGQVFSITRKADGEITSGDNSNLQQMLLQQNQPMIDGQSYQNHYATLVANVGSQAQLTKLQTDSAGHTLKSVNTALSNASGVNLDREAANLMMYQQFYQANSKALQTAQTIFASLLHIFG